MVMTILAVAALGCSPEVQVSAIDQIPLQKASTEVLNPNLCSALPEAATTQYVATPLGSLYAQGITPGLAEKCIPVIGYVVPGGEVTVFSTHDLMAGTRAPTLEGDTVVCYGTNATSVVKLCNSLGLEK
jgi:hypothetical protein